MAGTDKADGKKKRKRKRKAKAKESEPLTEHQKQMAWRKKREAVTKEESSSLKLHRAIMLGKMEDIMALVQEYTADEETKYLLDVRDHMGNTPLSLAVHLRQIATVELLLNNGADPLWKSGSGWSLIQESVATGDREVLTLLMAHLKDVMTDRFEKKIPTALEALQKLPDFYMELEWEFGTWVPLLSRLCPYDKYKIWKKGSWIRVDTTLIGFENLQWVRGEVSFLFTSEVPESDDGEEIEGYGGSHLVIIDHKKQVVEFALDSLKKYSVGGKKKDGNVTDLLRTDLMRVRLDVDEAKFEVAKTWLGYDRMEKVGGMWNAKVFDVSGIHRVTLKRADHRQRERGTIRPVIPKEDIKLDPEAYFADSPDPRMPKGTGLLFPHEEVKMSKKGHTAKVWLSEEFPVAIKDLLPLFAILAPSGKHFDKLESFLSMHLPSDGFPVRIGTVTFGVFDLEEEVDDAVFDIPKEYKVLAHNQSTLFKPRSKARREKDRKQQEKVEKIVRTVRGFTKKSKSKSGSSSVSIVAAKEMEEELAKLEDEVDDEEDLP